MAKQSQKTIEARIAELQNFGYLETDGGYIRNGQKVTNHGIESAKKELWQTIIEGIISTIEHEKGLPLSEGEQTQLQAATGKETPITLTLQTLEVGKFNLTNEEFTANLPIIQAWQKKCEVLTIADMTDKAGLKAVTEAKQVTRKTRTTLESVRKEKKAYWLEGGRVVDDVAKKYFAEIEATEAHLDGEIAKHEGWIKAEEIRKENEAKEKLNCRVNELKAVGLVFNEGLGLYCLGNISLPLVLISSWPDNEYANVLIAVKAEKCRIDQEAEIARLAEEKRLADEKKEREEFERKKKEQEEKELEFQRREKEFHEEKERMRKQKRQMREYECMQIGMTFASLIPTVGEAGYYFKNDYCNVAYIRMSAISDMLDNEFELCLSQDKQIISDAKQQAEAAAEKERQLQQRYQDRCQQLSELGMIGGGGLFAYSRPNVERKYTVTVDEVKDVKPEYWDKFLSGVAVACEAISAAQDEYEANKLAEEQRYQERFGQLIDLGMKYNNHGFFFQDSVHTQFTLLIPIEEVRGASVENWPDVLASIVSRVGEVKAMVELENARIAAAKEAAKPNIQKVQEYITFIRKYELPNVINGAAATILGEFYSQLENISETALNELSELENN